MSEVTTAVLCSGVNNVGWLPDKRFRWLRMRENGDWHLWRAGVQTLITASFDANDNGSYWREQRRRGISVAMTGRANPWLARGAGVR